MRKNTHTHTQRIQYFRMILFVLSSEFHSSPKFSHPHHTPAHTSHIQYKWTNSILNVVLCAAWNATWFPQLKHYKYEAQRQIYLRSVCVCLKAKSKYYSNFQAFAHPRLFEKVCVRSYVCLSISLFTRMHCYMLFVPSSDTKFIT